MASDRSSRFHTTHWSLIAALPGRKKPTADERTKEALEHLCEAYWRPLYAFARWSGYSAEDAQDLTQAFLTKIIETGSLGGADPERGRFRSYILGAMKHYMANERKHAKAQKRGGGRVFVQQDIRELESRIADGAAMDPAEAERAFDRSWAQETTGAALEQLEREWAARGKSAHFDTLHPALTGEGPDRTKAASRLGITENAVSVAIHRLRQRYAALVREAVARTVADETEIEDELRHLIGMLREK